LHPKNLADLGHGDHQVHSRPFIQRTAHFEAAANGLSAHPQIPQTIPFTKFVGEIVEAPAVVGDTELEPVALAINLDLDRVGPGVTDDVVENLFVNEENVPFELQREPVIVRLAMNDERILVGPQQL